MTPIPPGAACPFRIVVEGQEIRCPKIGPHVIHRYRGRSVEFVEWPEIGVD